MICHVHLVHVWRESVSRLHVHNLQVAPQLTQSNYVKLSFFVMHRKSQRVSFFIFNSSHSCPCESLLSKRNFYKFKNNGTRCTNIVYLLYLSLGSFTENKMLASQLIYEIYMYINIRVCIFWNLSVTCDRSVVFSGYSGFLHQ